MSFYLDALSLTFCFVFTFIVKPHPPYRRQSTAAQQSYSQRKSYLDFLMECVHLLGLLLINIYQVHVCIVNLHYQIKPKAPKSTIFKTIKHQNRQDDSRRGRSTEVHRKTPGSLHQKATSLRYKKRKSFQCEERKGNFIQQVDLQQMYCSQEELKISLDNLERKQETLNEKTRNTTASDSLQQQQNSTSLQEQPKSSYLKEQPRCTSPHEPPKRTSVMGPPKSTSPKEQPKRTSLKEQPKKTLLQEQLKSTLMEQPKKTSLQEQPKSTSLKEPARSTSLQEQSKSTSLKVPAKSTSLQEQPKSASLKEQPKNTSVQENPWNTVLQEQPRTSFQEQPRSTYLQTSLQEKPKSTSHLNEVMNASEQDKNNISLHHNDVKNYFRTVETSNAQSIRTRLKTSYYGNKSGYLKWEPEHKKLDLHKKTQQEAISSFNRFFNRQLQYYKENGYRDEDKYIFVITGHCKNRPGKVAKIKPEIQSILHGEHWSHFWFNKGGEVMIEFECEESIDDENEDFCDNFACNCYDDDDDDYIMYLSD